MNTSFISMDETAERLNVSPRKVYLLIEQGELPQPVKIGAKSCMVDYEIQEYMNKLIALRDGGKVAA